MVNSCIRKGLVGLLAGGMAVGLVACGGSSGGGGGSNETFKLTAEVQGLGPGELVLAVNGSEVTVGENGAFTLVESLDDGSDYTISVAGQPEGPLQDCQVSPASGQIESDLTVDVTCVTPVAIAGKLTVTGADGQTVTLTAGNVTETATADANGDFQLQAELADPDAVIRLDASAGDWHFRSLMGSVVGLGSDEDLPVENDRNRIDESVTGRANLNHLNTALSGQLQWHNGGALFDTHEALVSAGRELLTQEAADVAGALRLVTEEGEALPSYATDTLEAALDLPKALDWLDAIRAAESNDSGSLYATSSVEGSTSLPGRHLRPRPMAAASSLDESTDQALSDASVSSASITSVPEEMFVTAGHAWGYYSYAAKLDFLASESWMRESDGNLVNGPFNISGGDLIMDFSGYPDPYYTRTTQCDDGAGGQEQCTEERYYDQVVIEKVMDGLSGSMVKREATVRIEYPDNSHEPDRTSTTDMFVSLMEVGDNIALDDSQLAGELAMTLPPERWRLDPDVRFPSMSDIADLDAGGTVDLHRNGDSMVWEVRSDGDLEMRPTDGGNEVYRGWLLSGTADGEGYMLVDSDHSNTAGIVADKSIRRDASIFFQASDLEGRWELWEGASLPYALTFVLDYDRSSDPDIAYLGPESDLSDRAFRIEFNGDPSNPVFRLAACAGPGADPGDVVYTPPASIGLPSTVGGSGCEYYYHERTWQIIRTEGDRLYMVERQVRYLPDGGEWSLNMEQDTIRYFGDVGDAQL